MLHSRRRRFRREPIAISERLGRYRGPADSRPGSELAGLQAAWKEIAGAQAAANSIVVRRSRAGVVSVACASALWAQELHANRDVFTDRLVRAVPEVEITGIRFVVGDHVIPSDPAPRVRQAPAPTPQERAAAKAMMRDVSDPVIRDLLERAAAGQQAVARAGRKTPVKRRTPPS